MPTLAVIIGNRDFFPDVLIDEARRDILGLLAEYGVDAVLLDESEGSRGSLQSYADARACAALFARERARIDGVLVSLPNFGDEQAIADTLRLSGLSVPILVQAYPDGLGDLGVERRRDAYCGKISVCNNLRQYGLPYSLTTLHTAHPTDAAFRADLVRFLGVCRVANGLRRARIGAIGARPGAFKTVRYSEKLLEASGISVSTIDLSEVFGLADRIAQEDARLAQRVEAIREYVPTEGVPAESLARMARLALVIDDWMAENDLQASAIQCWNSVQANYRVSVCTLMSMMSERLMPSACEVDVAGAASMYALQLAGGGPAALVDWNNNYGADPDKCILFHCGNWAASLAPGARMAYPDILATTLGREGSYGALAARVPAGPLGFARISTDDRAGRVRAYVGDGEFTDDPLDTFGSRAVVRVPRLQRLMRHICREGFEHHVAMCAAPVAGILAEAFGTYLGWDVYHHNAPEE